MGVANSLSRGRELVERPFVTFLTIVGLYLVVDLIGKLAGVQVAVGGVHIVGGSLTGEQFLSILLDGIVLGLAYGLAGIGLSMTYSILNFANFGHGDYVTTGAFAGWAAAYLIAGLGSHDFAGLFLINNNAVALSIANTPLSILFGLVIAALFTIGLSLALDRIVYKPMRNDEGISLLIASIGVALALRYLLAFVFGVNVRGVTAQPGQVVVGPVSLTTHAATLVVVSIVLMAGMHVLLQQTKLGKAMRAMADNKSLAQVTGIPTERVIRMTWIIGGGLTGIAGYLIVLERGVMSFSFGWVLLLLIFAAVILGGIGSIYGAMAGGVIIGIVDTTSIIWLPDSLTRAGAFFILIVVLLVRPEGIFGGVKTA
ncbi:branched-chain amino acid ABC transporter permease [Natronomonas sp. EA1]|uniref:branched-chain amino acid ABC transporter permease n=1 Tax=Natronomonas sp. EA1 TaxID=3421655 RepID=UPI003EBA1F59